MTPNGDEVEAVSATSEESDHHSEEGAEAEASGGQSCHFHAGVE